MIIDVPAYAPDQLPEGSKLQPWHTNLKPCSAGLQTVCGLDDGLDRDT
jgi:hypothetical protein